MIASLSDDSKQSARQHIDRFVQRFDDSYRRLAYYAALPLVLTPDLLNYLRNQFLRGEVPWVAEIDLLLSELCSPTGYEQYVMETAVRAVLLEEMEQVLGRSRMEAVAQLLIDYVRKLARTMPQVSRRSLQNQQWAAMVYLDDQRQTAVEQIARSLQDAIPERVVAGQAGLPTANQAELAQLARITQELAPQLEHHLTLLEYARLVSQLLGDRTSMSQELLDRSYVVEGVELRLPYDGQSPSAQSNIEARSDGHVSCAIILTSLAVEYLAVRVHLTDLIEEVHPSGTIYEHGKFTANGQTWDVGLVEIGAGNSSAASEVERAIEHFKPNIILYVGIAGGIKDVVLGDVVVSTKVYGYESGKAKEPFRPRPDVWASAYSLEQRARVEAKKTDWLKRLSPLPSPPPKVYVAPTAAGEKVVDSTKSKVFQFMRSYYGDAVAVEMEGFGFLTAVWASSQVSGIVIRGISDLINGKDDDVEPEQVRQEKASRHASAFAFELLAKLQSVSQSLYTGGTVTIPLTDSQLSQQATPLPDLSESAQATSSEATPPKVFISYSHDSQEHMEQVLKLANRLRADGIDCNIDQYENSPAEGWQRWMLNQVKAADHVLIVCTQQYDRRFRGQEETGKGKGVTWEGGVIIQELYDAQREELKFIPVFFTAEDAEFIPSPLRSATFYRLDTTDGYERLYRRITNQPRTRKPNLSKLPTLPSRTRKKNFEIPIQNSQIGGQVTPTRLRAPHPITILFLAANPQGTGRLRLDQEVRDVSDALRRSQHRRQFELEQRWAVRLRDVQQAMLDLNPQIVHFSRHGQESGVGGEAGRSLFRQNVALEDDSILEASQNATSGLVFEDAGGNLKIASRRTLARLFRPFADQVQSVVLNGCYSATQADAIAQQIPYVIGISDALGKRDESAFVVGFYNALGAGRLIEDAYKFGCNAISLEEIPQYLTPVLLKRK
jgi:nucleoside phosphorylase